MVLSKCDDAPNPATCDICGQEYKIKGKCFDNHRAKCNKVVAFNILCTNSCIYCGKLYKDNGKWFQKHVQLCKVKSDLSSSEKSLNTKSGSEVNDFNFSDDYFTNELNNKLDDSVLESNSDSWLGLLDKHCHNHQGFKIIHLNVNSIFNKFEHIFTILDSLNFDIIALNEVKLDDSVPDKLYQHGAYNLKRRDRNSYGGGIMIYIKKCYKLINFSSSADFEVFSFKLNIGKIENNFIYAYKPPIVKNIDFIDHLDSIVKNTNLNNSLFIFGDLNMNWLDQNGKSLKLFCEENNLANYVTEPTRIATTKSHSSSTLIDVILHNKHFIDKTHVIDFPFSDHRIVLTMHCKKKV